MAVVMAAASALVVVVMAATAVVAVPSAATAFAAHAIYKALYFLVCGLARLYDVPLEVERLACKWVGWLRSIFTLSVPTSSTRP